ncbi:putative transposase [Candidatus Erwinia dacicola]|uniref:Transposase n=1 Tax=Candidatus Erwinia dacicola TaxID=252393 RepID=A0A328THP1_9GAMM|nr:putative transposase [Candidatus Erwinia dacicola]
MGKDQKSFLLTTVDKATKQVIIRKLANKRAKSVVEAFSDIVANTLIMALSSRSITPLRFVAFRLGMGPGKPGRG